MQLFTKQQYRVQENEYYSLLPRYDSGKKAFYLCWTQNDKEKQKGTESEEVGRIYYCENYVIAAELWFMKTQTF